jgi:hypothetical protein
MTVSRLAMIFSCLIPVQSVVIVDGIMHEKIIIKRYLAVAPFELWFIPIVGESFHFLNPAYFFSGVAGEGSFFGVNNSLDSLDSIGFVSLGSSAITLKKESNEIKVIDCLYGDLLILKNDDANAIKDRK